MATALLKVSEVAPIQELDSKVLLRVVERMSVVSQFQAMEAILSRVPTTRSMPRMDLDSEARPAAMADVDETEFNNYKASHYRSVVNALGESVINVCDSGGDIEIGDYICTSAVAGKGQRYDGPDLRCIVAKAVIGAKAVKAVD